jgi:hypothetical protein
MVTFDSDPPGADVLVDGKLVGRTPAKVPLLAKTEHYVEFVMVGFEREVRAISASVGVGWLLIDIVPGIFLGFLPLIVDAAAGSWRGLDEESVQVRLRQTTAPIAANPAPVSPVSPVPPPPDPRPAPGTGPVVAVFDIEDSAGLLEPAESSQLTDYLAARVAATAGFRVVPRAQLRASLSEAKSEGYASCFDEACQIELGRALAAEKSLSTKLLRVGTSCAIVVSLFDLRTETAEKAATVRTDCSEAALLGAVDQIAAQLAPR